MIFEERGLDLFYMEEAIQQHQEAKEIVKMKSNGKGNSGRLSPDKAESPIQDNSSNRHSRRLSATFLQSENT